MNSQQTTQRVKKTWAPKKKLWIFGWAVGTWSCTSWAEAKLSLHIMQGQKVFVSNPEAESETAGMVAIRWVLKVFTWSQSTSGGPSSGNHPGGPFFRGFRDSSDKSDILEKVKYEKSPNLETRREKIPKSEIIVNPLFPKMNHSISATCSVLSELRLLEPRQAAATDPLWVLSRKLWAKGSSRLETLVWNRERLFYIRLCCESHTSSMSKWRRIMNPWSSSSLLGPWPKISTCNCKRYFCSDP